MIIEIFFSLISELFCFLSFPFPYFLIALPDFADIYFPLVIRVLGEGFW